MVGLTRGRKENNVRRYPGKGGSKHNPVRIEERCKEAKERLEAWQKMSPQDQLATLDRRCGSGKGAAKQRARIAARIKSPNAKVAVVEQPVQSAEHKQKAKERRELNRKARHQFE